MFYPVRNFKGMEKPFKAEKKMMEDMNAFRIST